MSKFTVKDGTEIYYKDLGTGQPIFFHHGWPLSADDWDAQIFFFLEQGYRVIAHDRRGHGRSTQTATGNEMDTYAADVDELTTFLGLKDAIHVGHSTGGGEAIHYAAKYGKSKVSKVVLISAVTPYMIVDANNPNGVPLAVFDDIRANTANNRQQFYHDITFPFYGYNREGADIKKGIQDNWWRQGMNGGIKAHYDCIKAFSETNFTEDLKSVDFPVLILHGEDDQIVPYATTALSAIKLLKNGKIITYPGLPHGMPTTHAAIINADLLAFIKS
ncbi:non-heme chloroperoxidase [Flavobacterium sp. 90]|uniref:alpha/beta fold hydrolase n=1 Tax=unclassified Flavobacterium TaxID=196869 RepID=UPI000EAF5977|nr:MULTISPECIES: alpha/beta hydrolase [unclassified Flavobacterium]RKR05739.1 non-heme chloroperoxidase [Flavobacterium sp. 81]TCK57050.1 non-heme chloroperoxidase [Flavobacterium sp. 90]